MTEQETLEGAAMAIPAKGNGTDITTHETTAIAVAEQARAVVQARYVMAFQRPRDMDEARSRLMRDCQRPGFAEASTYKRPIGDGKSVTGPSIRFAEAAARAMGNIDVQSPTVYEDPRKRIVRVSATDLETNMTYSTDITITKEVERRRLKQDQVALGTRRNSYGDVVYIVEASESDLTTKAAALTSKAIRGLIMRLVPADITEECMATARSTVRDTDAEDPDAARKRLVDGFAALNIPPSALKKHLGHDLGTTSPAELTELRQLYAAIHEGDLTWSDVMARKDGDEGGEQDGAKPKGRAASVKDQLQKRASRSRKESPSKQAEAEAAETPPHDPETGEVPPDAEPTDEEMAAAQTAIDGLGT